MHTRNPCIRLGAAMLLAATTGFAQQAVVAPRPLDPLTESERSLADSVARADSRLRALLGPRGAELVEVSFVAGKLRDAQGREPNVESTRHAAVQYFLRASNAGVTALVDLRSRSVTDVARQRGSDVPLGSTEVDRAVKLALADARVQQLFEGTVPRFRQERAGDGLDTAATRVDAIRIVAARGDPCFNLRCVALFFRVDNRYVHQGRVVVDLLRDSVIVRGGAR